jgi:hypothetical protein
LNACTAEPEATKGSTARVTLPLSLEEEVLSGASEPDTEGVEHYPLTDLDYAQIAAARPLDQLQMPMEEPQPTSKQAAALKASALPADQLVPIMVLLPRDPFSHHVYRRPGLDNAIRSAILALREEQIRQRTAPMRNQLAALGATNLIEFTISPIVAATVRAGDIAKIASWTDIDAIDVGPFQGEVLAGYDGEKARQGVGISALASNVDGSQGHWNGGGRVRVGIIDTNAFYVDAAGFRRALGDTHDTIFRSTAGVSQHFLCFQISNAGCGTFNSADNQPSHASNVARVLLGTIENGQDPAFSANNARIQRSGVIPKSGIDGYHYGVAAGLTSVSDIATINALELATEGSPSKPGFKNDILNMSFTFPSYFCKGTSSSFDSFTSAIQEAVKFNALPVVAIGNSGSGGAKYPACRREVLTTAWLNTQNETTAYNQSSINASSSHGGIQVSTSTGATATLAIADLSAPGDWNYLYQTPGSGLNAYKSWNPTEGSGSSLAAPVVSGVAALFRHGWSISKPGVPLSAADLLTHMLLLGDGYAQTISGYAPTGFDSRSGAGRVHMHHPGSASMGTAWGWSDPISADVSAGGGVRGFITTSGLPTSAKQLKVVMTWQEPTTGSYNNIADITLQVNNASGLSVTDASRDMRKRVSLTTTTHPWIGTSPLLMWNVQVNAMPAGQKRRVHVAWYWHSNPSPGEH